MSSSGLCLQPSCYRTFKGVRGLNIHLGQSKCCDTWYKEIAQNRSPSILADSRPIVDPVASTIEGSQSSPVPWSSTQGAPRLARRGKSVTIEEVIESDDSGLGDVDGYNSDDEPSRSATNYIKPHPTAGKIYGKGRTILQEIDDKDEYKKERKTNVYHPFMSRQDFEMGAWLSQSNASMSQIDDFLKLPYVRIIFSIYSRFALLTLL